MSQYNASVGGGIVGPRSFGSAISICLSNYVGFSGRAPRSEYWFFELFLLIVYVVGIIIDVTIGHQIVMPICSLGLILPTFAVLMRRLHDLDKSGWWWLISFIPLVGAIWLLVLMCTRGTAGPNRFGPDPLGGPVGWGGRVAA